jgi:hypothetical protein
MTIQPISYRGRTLAACTRRRVFLSRELETLAPDDPTRLFVLEMCLYAGEILNGYRPGPYRDDDARAHVRRQLIPAELLERPKLRAEVAAVLCVPVEEVRVAHAAVRARARRRRLPLPATPRAAEPSVGSADPRSGPVNDHSE